MIGPRNSREDAEYRRIVYVGTDIYRNKLRIRDRALLDEAERILTERRARQGFPSRAEFRSYAGFRAIHRHLFQDVYAWAGKERRFTTGRGPAPFALPEYIRPTMEQLFTALATEDFLVDLDKQGFTTRAAYYVNEFNAVHPFIDGNGRRQRFWLRMLAANAGFRLRLRSADRVRWNDASRLGFLVGDHSPMAALIKLRLAAVHA